ncbi:MAG: IclR family transcriptional regulator [Actinomycetota bacterium]|nr:IclR family transcriptional regulator [Actinomycetota bacterium]
MDGPDLTSGVEELAPGAAPGPNGAGRADLQVVARVATLLRLITPNQATIGLTEATEALGPGVSKSTAHRYLNSLVNHGFLKRVDGTRYTLGALVDQLGVVAANRWRVMEVAGPVMQELATGAHQTVVLSVWGGMGPVIARVTEDTSQVVHISVSVGSTLPLESAQGLMFLAHLTNRDASRPLVQLLPPQQLLAMQDRLEQIRADGIASHEQMVAGVRAMAVPVLERDGTIVATLAVVGTLNSVPADTSSGVAQALTRSGKQLSRLVQGHTEEG